MLQSAILVCPFSPLNSPLTGKMSFLGLILAIPLEFEPWRPVFSRSSSVTVSKKIARFFAVEAQLDPFC